MDDPHNDLSREVRLPNEEEEAERPELEEDSSSESSDSDTEDDNLDADDDHKDNNDNSAIRDNRDEDGRMEDLIKDGSPGNSPQHNPRHEMSGGLNRPVHEQDRAESPLFEPEDEQETLL